MRVKGGTSLRNGMWHGLRNDIIMRINEWPKETNYTKKGAPFLGANQFANAAAVLMLRARHTTTMFHTATKIFLAFSRAAWQHRYYITKVGHWIAWDHALSLAYCPFMSLTGRGHDTFLCRITCKKARIWTFFWLDRKQYGWFALFRLAKMPPSVSCCWFQSAFLLA